MRITSLILSQNLLQNLETAQNNLDEYQNQLSTGKKIFKPSDDPVGIETDLRLKSSLNSLQQWSTNAADGLSFLQTTDSSLGNISDMLQRARELAVQGASDTLGSEDRKDIAFEVQQITDQIGVIANTKYGNKYLFGGTNTNKPWDGTTWTGNSGAINYEVGSGSTLQVSTDGTSLFNSGGIFSALNTFTSDLNNNDQSAISNDLDAIDTQLQAVMNKRADVGARTNRMDSIQQQIQSMQTNLTQSMSGVEDVDVAKVAIQLNSQQNVYRAALSVGAQIIQPSLVDFIK